MMDFWLQVNDRHKIISAIARLEASSAIHRWRIEGRITAEETSTTLTSVIEEIRLVTELPLTQPVLGASMAIVERRSLRPLDAIQLGSAIVARKTLTSPGMRFIASDQALLAAAQAEGFTIWDPTVIP